MHFDLVLSSSLTLLIEFGLLRPATLGIAGDAIAALSTAATEDGISRLLGPPTLPRPEVLAKLELYNRTMVGIFSAVHLLRRGATPFQDRPCRISNYPIYSPSANPYHLPNEVADQVLPQVLTMLWSEVVRATFGEADLEDFEVELARILAKILAKLEKDWASKNDTARAA